MSRSVGCIYRAALALVDNDDDDEAKAHAVSRGAAIAAASKLEERARRNLRAPLRSNPQCNGGATRGSNATKSS